MEALLNSETRPPYCSWLAEIDQVRSSVATAEAAVRKNKGVTVLVAKQKSLELVFSQYMARWANLVDALATHDIDLDLFLKEHQSVSGKYDNVLEFVAEAVDTHMSTSRPTPVPPGSAVNAFRLPDIRLPDFHGDVEAFPQFWELFKSLVDDRTDLSVALKFTYLKSCLKGSSARVLAGFSVDAHNYSQAKQLLQSTYKDNERVQRKLILQLINVKSPGHNAKELSEFRITCNQIIRSLESNNDVNSALWFIKELLLAKMSKDTQSFLFQREKSQYFSYEAFDEGLKVLIDLLETTSHPNSKHEPVKVDSHTSKIVSSSSSPKTKLVMQAASSAPVVNSASKNVCSFCKESHLSVQCPTYLTPTDRKSALYQNKCCFKCGGGNHFATSCYRKLSCYKCKGAHWAPLCPTLERNGKPQKGDPKGPGKSVSTSQSKKGTSRHVLEAEASVDTTSENITANPQFVKTAGNRSVALPTAIVKVKSHKRGQKAQLPIRCFFDTGAQKSFLHPEVVEKLKLRPQSYTSIRVAGFGQKPTEVQCPVVKLNVALGKRVATIDFLVTERVEMTLYTPGLTQVMSHLKNDCGLSLADANAQDTIDDISAILGADSFTKYVQGVCRVSGIELLRSPGGYMVYGQLPMRSSNETINNQSVAIAKVCIESVESEVTQVLPSEEPPVHQLWELDVVGITPDRFTPDEQNAVNKFTESLVYSEGKYWVRLPWKRDAKSLPTNYRMAVGQFRSLMCNLWKNPEKLQLYNEIIEDYLNQGFIERVTSNDIRGHYLPHHPVFKDSVTTPLRIVFNASAKQGPEAVSLNDMLDTGPSLTEKLVDSLLSFRVGRFALTADISKAFLRVGLQESDRDYVRFLWTSDVQDPSATPQTYRFKSVMFGSTSSPFLLQITLKNHLENHPSVLAPLINKSFYVDNFLTVTDNEADLYSIRKAAMDCLDQAGMPLREWNSNSVQFNGTVGDSQRKESPSILGMKWNTSTDTLYVNNPQVSTVTSLTKRRALSVCSSLFDPLGLASPLTIRGKLLIRDLWKLKVGWDEEVDDMYVNQLNALIAEYNQVDLVTFPRSAGLKDETFELHVFADASSQAYGAVAYLVSQTTSTLLISRARVAPVKQKSIPQLELTALLLGCRLAKYIVSTLDLKGDTYVWSDNLPCLQWVSNNNSNIVYVRNRVGEILELKSQYKMVLQHITTKENPADLLSRGCSITQLKSDLWLHGPSWLLDHSCWPEPLVTVAAQEILTQNVQPTLPESIFSVERFSNLQKLLNATQYVVKFLKHYFPLKFCNFNALLYWVKHEQRVHYPLVYHALQTKSHENKYKDSHKFIADLNLYLDDQGIIRCKGRLERSRVAFNVNNLVLLPPKSFLCTLLIRDTHVKNLHAGVQHCLSSMRDEYWIPHGRQTVKGVVNHCTTCKYTLRKKFIYPGPPPLPRERVTFDRPFQCVGVDNSGCILVKEGEEYLKYYICLFTCCSSRAVHLELTDSLSAEAFILCFRRFVARRSLPEKLISDNGKNFVAASKFLMNLQEAPEIQEYLHNNKITWQFNSPRAPWQGGLFERLISIVKGSLHKVFHRRTITRDELQTTLVEIESVVNNRPLLYLGDDSRACEALAPSHLLYGRKLKLYPTIDTHDFYYDDLDNTDILLEYHNKINQNINKFSGIWEREYLQALREKHYTQLNSIPTKIPQVGEVVIVAQGPKNEWSLGKIVELVHGLDGAIREVKVRTKGSISRKTIDKLIPMELTAPSRELESEFDLNIEGDPGADSEVSELAVEGETDLPEEQAVRPRRLAAAKADRDRQELIEQGLL